MAFITNRRTAMNRTYLTVLSLTLILNFAFPLAYAEEDKKVSGKWEDLIGPPPARDSVEEDADVDTLLNFQNTRTDEDCRLAALEEKVSLKTFFGGTNAVLTDKEVKKLQVLFFLKMIKGGLVSSLAKKHFARPRPFLTFSEIQTCIHKPSSESYPSGHATVARLMAHALAKKFPDRALAIYKRADDVARNRMLGGVHYPSDVAAGKKLADHLARKLLTDKDFVQELLKD